MELRLSYNLTRTRMNDALTGIVDGIVQEILGHIGRFPSMLSLVLRILCHIGWTTSTGVSVVDSLVVISVSSASYPAGLRKPLIRWIGKTQRDGIMGDRILPMLRRNTRSPGPMLEY
ncbi:hypothetical protein YC2023_088565 [Brassica napus]